MGDDGWQKQTEKAGPRLGILPLYLELYDRTVPQYRAGREAFARALAERLGGAGIDVRLAQVCCVRSEVDRELRRMEAEDIDMLATLHLSYSPSLEAAEPLAGLDLPLALLDTTAASRFDECSTLDDMLENHGIHGVQDLASVLRRIGRAYFVIAGHHEDERFLAEVVAMAGAAAAAKALRRCKTLLIGEPFEGMGDFAVGFDVLRESLGPTVQDATIEDLAARVGEVSEADLDAEMEGDRERYDTSGIPAEVLRESNRVGLAVRSLLRECGADAFSMNFQGFDIDLGVPTVPFLEASKAMARGIGYAGEGDVLTASLVGALAAGFGPATFTEMFCPDWEGDSLFMSHMGECNLALASSRPRLVEKDYVFGNVRNPAVAIFPLAPGPATLVNIAPGPVGSFSVIASHVEVLDRSPSPNFPGVPHFWVRPAGSDVRDFLRLYSEAGGTHHLVLLLGERKGALWRMARILELRFAGV